MIPIEHFRTSDTMLATDCEDKPIDCPVCGQEIQECEKDKCEYCGRVKHKDCKCDCEE